MSPLTDLPTLLWVVGFQMGVYALMWVLSLVLLQESRRAVAHWALFMALLSVGFVLAALRGEPRHWLPYKGTNAITLIAFALMRRGTEMFMGLRPSDREQFLMLVPAMAWLVWLGPERDDAPQRIVVSYGLQALILARTLWVGRGAMAQEFGRTTMWGIAGSASVLVAVLLALALRQALAWPVPTEMQTPQRANVGLMFTYLGGSAL